MEFDAEIAYLAHRHHGLIDRGHLDRLGVPADVRWYRVTTGRWHEVYDGVYRIAGAPDSWESRLLAACWAGGARAVASHRSAAALWQLPGADREVIEVMCPRWRRARHPGLVVHESTMLSTWDTATVTGIPCTSIERTILDMCGRGGPAFADLLIDSALRRRLTTMARLVRARDRLAKRGRRGGARFREALERRDPGAALPESEPERMLARYLVAQGLPVPTLQHEVRSPEGRFVARVDLAYPDAQVAIEYDSYQEHTGVVALDRDSARRNALVSIGWSVVTATPPDLRNRAHRLSRDVAALLARAAPLSR